MPEISEESVLGSLEGAFGDGPPVVVPKPPAAKPPTAPNADDQEAAAIVEEALPDTPEEIAAREAAEAAQQPEPTPSAPELELEIEVNGEKEIIRGDTIKELAAKGRHAGRQFEENARVREALIANAQALQDAQAFQQAIMGDVADYRSLESQIAQYQAVDWQTAFDSDFVGALKAKQTLETLKEKAAAKRAEIDHKSTLHQQNQANISAQVLAAETQALVAKLPEWRNSERGLKESGEIRQWLITQGYQPAEVGVIPDHRHMLIARKAFLYDQLLAKAKQRVNQVREAPPVSRPGAVSAGQDSGKAGFQKFTQELRKQGQKGNNRAQEALMLKALNRTFK